MDSNVLIGKWVNEFGSVMTISDINAIKSSFSGTYISSTGASGEYNITGCFNPVIDANINSLTTVVAISWNNIQPDAVNTLIWDMSVSSMAGEVKKIGETYIFSVIFVLVKPTLPGDGWKGSYIDKLTFTKL